MFSEADVIHCYTRAQALEDGLLVDVTSTAKELGFTKPVAVTRGVWDEVITPDPRAAQLGQDETGRLVDVLWILACRAGAHGRTDTMHFNVLMIVKTRQKRLVTLKAVCGPGDDGEVVITVMLPAED